MRRKSNYIYSFKSLGTVIALFTVILGCSHPTSLKQYPIQNRFDWLIGTWVDNAQVFENWSKIDTQEYIGISYTLNKGDTLVRERIRLFWQDTSWIYQPQVFNQNNGEPIRFLAIPGLIRCTDHSYLRHIAFQNKSHDFPQQIRYQLIKNDSLIAHISGSQNDSFISLSFEMKRVKSKNKNAKTNLP